MTRAGWLLALDTATSRVVIATGTPDGAVLASDSFVARHRHSQELLPAITRLLDAAGLQLRDLRGVVVGTGPGAFTGLRVGLATAKTLAHELRVPVVGIATSDALLAEADDGAVLWLPSGPRDRVAVTRGGEPAILREGEPGLDEAPRGERPEGEVREGDEREGRAGEGGAGAVVAVDLEGRAPAEALERGARALDGLAAALLRLGAARIAAGEADDPERLVPRYASTPRGVTQTGATPDGGVSWSRDPR